MKKDFQWDRVKENLKWVVFGISGVLIGILLLVYGVIPAFSRQVPNLANYEETQTPEPDPLMAQSISEKEAIAANIETAILAGKNDPARKDVRIAPDLPAIKSPEFQEGIFTGEPGPFYSGAVLVENLWQGKRAGQFIQVFAGVDGAEPSQGVVIVLITEADRGSGEETWFRTPTASGPVQILDKQSDILLIGNEEGARFFFDLNQMDFIESP